VTGLVAQVSPGLFAHQRTQFTGSVLAPSFAHVDSATAVLFGEFDGQFVATLAVAADGGEAIAASCIDAALSILAGYKAFVADTIVTRVRVDTLAILANALLLTFIGFAAFVGLLVSFLTGRTFTSERADGVDALAAFAQGRNGLAFVDIDTLAAVDVLEESFVAVEFGRALLARMTPSFADRGAAELFSADHSLQLALAHVIADASETWARTIICFTSTSGESVNAGASIRPDAAASVQTRLRTDTCSASA